MRFKTWEDIPDFMRCDEIRPYYDSLAGKRGQLAAKRLFDIMGSLVLIVILALPMLIIAVMIKLDSSGTVFYRQERVTSYGRIFWIHKFRTMVRDADKIGTHVTVGDDVRITRIGATLRKYRLDELPQLIDILRGDMTFVGTRPEAVRYVKRYTPEMMATLLLPAGVTSEASIRFKNEAKMLEKGNSVEETYITEILPMKMKYNLDSIRSFSILGDFVILFKTFLSII